MEKERETDFEKYVREETNVRSLRDFIRQCVYANCNECVLARNNFRKCLIAVMDRELEIKAKE